LQFALFPDIFAFQDLVEIARLIKALIFSMNHGGHSGMRLSLRKLELQSKCPIYITKKTVAPLNPVYSICGQALPGGAKITLCVQSKELK
jgi:hypothetical protein